MFWSFSSFIYKTLNNYEVHQDVHSSNYSVSGFLSVLCLSLNPFLRQQGISCSRPLKMVIDRKSQGFVVALIANMKSTALWSFLHSTKTLSCLYILCFLSSQTFLSLSPFLTLCIKSVFVCRISWERGVKYKEGRGVREEFIVWDYW